MLAVTPSNYPVHSVDECLADNLFIIMGGISVI